MYVKQFNKRFDFRATNKNVRKTVKMQLVLAQSEDIENKAPKEQLEDIDNMIETVEEYIKGVLKLNNKDVEKLDELEMNETIDLANKIAMRIMGIDEDEAKKVVQNPKKS